MTKAFDTDRNELFQNAWLKIREKEIKGKSFDNVKNFQSYFFLTLRNVFIDGKRKQKHKTILINDRIRNKADEQPNQFEPCEADLIEWMYEKPKDDNDEFYKNILILQTKIKVHKDVQVQTTMDRITYLQARKKAAKKAKDEITNRITNNSDIHINDVV